jgi:hypothetical protein
MRQWQRTLAIGCQVLTSILPRYSCTRDLYSSLLLNYWCVYEGEIAVSPADTEFLKTILPGDLALKLRWQETQRADNNPKIIPCASAQVALRERARYTEVDA